MPEKNSSNTSIVVRAIGSIVVLAAISSAALTTLFFFKPWLFSGADFPPGHPGHLLGETLLGCFIVGGVGGLAMLAVTKKPRWIITLVLVGSSIALITLIGIGLGSAFH